MLGDSEVRTEAFDRLIGIAAVVEQVEQPRLHGQLLDISLQEGSVARGVGIDPNRGDEPKRVLATAGLRQVHHVAEMVLAVFPR
jgi:hypothetical protein